MIDVWGEEEEGGSRLVEISDLLPFGRITTPKHGNGCCLYLPEKSLGSSLLTKLIWLMAQRGVLLYHAS